MANTELRCSFENCDRPIQATGLCARHYQRKRAGKPLQTKCGNCGVDTDRPRYCSVRCSQVARDRRNGAPSWAERYPAPKCKIERQCVVCGTAFARKTDGRDAGLCCSRKCGFTLQRWRGEQSRLFHEAKRQFADWADTSRPSGFKVRIDAVRKRLERKQRPCPTCGQPIGHGLYRRYCSPSCYVVNPESVRRSRRASKARRRAVERGAEAERFDPMEVLARDGWHCHICGVSTPRRLRGTYDDRAPELDHIIPLASGGQHTRLNTACACRRCNIAKSDKPLGQLRLVA